MLIVGRSGTLFSYNCVAIFYQATTTKCEVCHSNTLVCIFQYQLHPGIWLELSNWRATPLSAYSWGSDHKTSTAENLIMVFTTLLSVFIVDGVITKPTSVRFRQLVIKTTARVVVEWRFFFASTKELVRRLNSLFELTNFEVAMYSVVNTKGEIIVCSTTERAEGARGKAFTCKLRTNLLIIYSRHGKLNNGVRSTCLHTCQLICLHY